MHIKICAESTADGYNFFLVNNKQSFKNFVKMSKEELGSPDEVNYWGGWKYDLFTSEKEREAYGFGNKTHDDLVKWLRTRIDIATPEKIKEVGVSELYSYNSELYDLAN